MKHVFYLLSLLLCSQFLCGQAVQRTADSIWFEKGLRYDQRAVYDSSISCFLKVISNPDGFSGAGGAGQMEKQRSALYLHSFLYLGTIYNKISEPEKALDILNRGYVLCDSGTADLQEMKSLFLFQQANAWLIAMDFRRAISIYLEVLKQIPGDGKLALRIHENLGGIFFFLEDYEKSLEQYQQTMAVLAVQKQADPGKSAELIMNAGSAIAGKGEYAPALAYYMKADSIAATLKGSGSRIRTRLAMCSGEICLKIGQPEQAKLFFIRSIVLLDPGDPGAAEAMILAYTGLAAYFNACAAFDSAIFYGLKAYSLIGQISGNGLFLLSQVCSGLAHSFESKKESMKALGYLEQAGNSLALQAGGTGCEAWSQPLAGIYSFELFRIRMQMSLLLAREQIRKRSFEELKQTFSEMKNLIGVSEQLNSQLGRDASKLVFNESVKDLCYGALEAGYFLASADTAADPAHLFLLSERGRSPILTHAVMSRSPKECTGIPDSLYTAKQKLNGDIVICMKHLSGSEGEWPDDQYLNYLNRLLDARKDLDSLEACIRRISPSGPPGTAGKKEVPVSGICRLLKRNEALVEYFCGDSSIFIFVIRQDTLLLERIHYTEGLRDAVSRFSREIRLAEESGVHSTGRMLYNELISPVGKALGHANRLIFIPDETLSIIPFEALIRGIGNKGRQQIADYLLNEYEVLYQVSAALWAESVIAPPAPANLFGYAGFAPEKFDFYARDFAAGEGSSELHSLPFSGEEVEMTREMIRDKAGSTALFTGEQATKTNFIKTADTCRILHIATHSAVSSGGQGIAGLVFYPDSTEDYHRILSSGILTLDEIFNLRLNCDLLVLSACATGTGRITRTEGVLAMTRGFYAAGAANIIYTLWNVSDHHTRDFMRNFFECVNKGENYASALRHAKLRMISNPSTSLPRIWAPYLLIGR